LIAIKFEEAKEKAGKFFNIATAPDEQEAESTNSYPIIVKYTEPPSARENTPSFDRTLKPNLLSSSEELRTIKMADNLVPSFLSVAQSNTSKNVETCGILSGNFSHNCFTITDILIPHQSGTSDSCLTEKEELMFHYQDEHDLMTLGWIHTHPSQNAFMSSIDLHTHCSYQLMLLEAIAIVCAPTFDEVGIFSLTPDHGLAFVSNCTQSGFHPHPKHPKIYEQAKHVVISSDYQINIVDLRQL